MLCSTGAGGRFTADEAHSIIAASQIMNLLEFNTIAASERRSARYLLGLCKKKDAVRCPACLNERLYIIEGGKRRRCAKCGHSFPPFAGRWLDEAKISARKWLWIVKLFELETPATIAAEEIGISYPTVLKMLDIIRSAIAGTSMDDAAKPADPTEEATVFGISSANEGGASLEALSDDRVLLKIRLKGGRLLLADRSVEFPRLSWSGCPLEIVDLGKRYPHGRVYCSEKGFWPYAKERLMRHHGVSLVDLPIRLKEIDFRWTNRRGKLFEAVIERLCDFASGPATGKAHALAASV